MQKSMFNQLSSAYIPKKFCQTWAKFAKRAYFAVYKTKLNKTIVAKNISKKLATLS